MIFATGFEVGTPYVRRAGYEILGSRGRTLSEKWTDGMATLHGMQSRGFPNCFFMQISQTAFTANFPHLLEELTTHLSHIIGHALDRGISTIEVSQDAEDAWVATIREKGLGAMGALGGVDCTPGYYNNEGQAREPGSIQAAPYGGGSIEFFRILQQWRDDGDFAGLEFTHSSTKDGGRPPE
jgi:cyclohexanone monooxygenase